MCVFENKMGERDNPKCTDDWTSYCQTLNKTCFVDEEEILQCGTCLNGYHLINGKCSPLNAAGNCADPAKNDCDINAQCIDVNPGSHMCICRNGFIGDGIHCDDVDECTMPGTGTFLKLIQPLIVLGICGPNSLCQNYPGGFKCICKFFILFSYLIFFILGHPGFKWNGKECEASLESNAKSCLEDKSLCHLNAECTVEGVCKCGKY